MTDEEVKVTYYPLITPVLIRSDQALNGSTAPRGGRSRSRRDEVIP